MGAVLISHANDSAADPEMLGNMFRLRYGVFKKRLKWEVPCANGLERDEYDELGPIYGLFVNGKAEIGGCWRLLPTTGPYMLKDIFSELLGNYTPPIDEAVWEISRFAVATADDGCRSFAAPTRVTNQLLQALLRFCLANGIRRVVAASDIPFERILKRNGLVVHRYGPVKKIGSTRSVAGWIDVSSHQLGRVESLCRRDPADGSGYDLPVGDPIQHATPGIVAQRRAGFQVRAEAQDNRSGEGCYLVGG